tara:strand:- start:155 stop:298 length:144 start_codon:yes stop_codon:yes gene_type:complete
MAQEADKIITSMSMAAEATLLRRDFYLPIGMTNGGQRLTTLTRWIME